MTLTDELIEASVTLSQKPAALPLAFVMIAALVGLTLSRRIIAAITQRGEKNETC